MEDTIIALNTGTLRTRDEDVLKNENGKTVISNPVRREWFDTIEEMLAEIRK